MWSFSRSVLEELPGGSRFGIGHDGGPFWLIRIERRLTCARESLLFPVLTGPAFRQPPLIACDQYVNDISYGIPEA